MTVPATPAPAEAPVPGKTLGVVGLVLAFLMPLIGAIISGVALSQSKKAGVPNGLAKAGLIIGIILTVLGIIIGIVATVVSASLVGGAIDSAVQICNQLGPGEHTVGGITYTCS